MTKSMCLFVSQKLWLWFWLWLCLWLNYQKLWLWFLVHVCVCVYALLPVGFFRLHDICDIHEKFGSMIFCCEHFLGVSAKFLHLYLRIYLISPPKTKTPAALLLERKRYDIMLREKMIYIDIGNKSARTKPTNYEKILKVRRLL